MVPGLPSETARSLWPPVAFRIKFGRCDCSAGGALQTTRSEQGAGVIVGIDLGTTNCACAVFRDGGVEMVPNSLGHVLTPSAVSIDGEKVITGLAARERQSTHPQLTATAFKRYMGTQHKTQLGKLSFRPEELSALMLKGLKADAEAYLGQAVERKQSSLCRLISTTGSARPRAVRANSSASRSSG
jgi:hypothetical protein